LLQRANFVAVSRVVAALSSKELEKLVDTWFVSPTFY